MRLLKSLFSIHPASLTLCIILLVVGLFFASVPLLDLIELRTYDLRVLSRGHVPPSPAVVLVLVDEKSLDTEGRWPWPRSKIAALVDRLSQDGAKVIGFDIGFLEPDENSQLAFIEQFSQQVETLAIQHPQLADFIAESRQHADNDLALANAIKNSSAAVVLGYFFHGSDAEIDYRLDQQDIDQQLERINTSKYPIIKYKDLTQGFTPVITSLRPGEQSRHVH